MGLLSNLLLFNTPFNNSSSSNDPHNDDDLEIEIEEGELEIEVDDSDTIDDIIRKVNQKLDQDGVDYNDAIIEISECETNDETLNFGRSKEQHFEKITQDITQLKPKE